MPGYLLVIAAGFFQGSFMLPMKFTKRWAWENTWLVFSLTAYLVWPWVLALITIPNLKDTLTSVSLRTLVLVETFGIGWAFGALTFGLGVDILGLALGFTLIIGLAASAGTLIPLIVLRPEKLFERQGLLTGLGVVLVVAGAGLCSWAGKLRRLERTTANSVSQGSYATGLTLCVVSGLLSSCGNLGFAFGTEVVTRAIQEGATESFAGNALWALITIPLFFCNLVYTLRLLSKNLTGSLFFLKGTGHYWILGTTMGLLWIAGFVCYAPGARSLGTFGTSIGWSIMMSAMVITANSWGLLTGEWEGAPGKALGSLASGVAMLIIAICVVGYANHG
jgi:L-rhamnose-H+ transport protein